MKAFLIISVLSLAAAACSSEHSGSKIPANHGSSAPASSPPANLQSTSESHSYTVLGVKDISVMGRKRFSVSIMAPAAKTFEDRGQTVVLASKYLQQERGAQVVEVWLEPNENTRGLGFVLAMATYSPDGKGMSGMENGIVWDNVSASDYQIGPKALKMTKTSNLDDIGMEQARVISSRRRYTPN